MIATRIGLAAAAATAMVATTGSPAFSAPAIPLNGAQEASAADPDGRGFFTYELNGTEFCWTLQWEDIGTATAAHVHVGPRNVAGPVVIPLAVGDGSGEPVEGCTTISEELAADIEANPKAYYVNVHNAEFPAGAIRGQLKRS